MPDLSWWLQNFQRSAFRLECLPEYKVPQEEEWLAAFKRDGSLPDLTPENDSWLKLVRTHAQHGCSMRRVRIVSHPLTDYERFELALFSASVKAGEDIRIAGSSPVSTVAGEGRRTGLPDFWLFDDEVAIVLRYDREARFLGTEQAKDLVTYQRMRDLALSRSLEMSAYTARAAR
jgi:uncharacterized protein DUF6879